MKNCCLKPKGIESTIALEYTGKDAGRFKAGDIFHIKRQDTAQNGDLVAVQIDGVEGIRLYRYYDSAYGFVLASLSETGLADHYRNEDRHKVKIIGKAVAYTATL